MNEETHIHPFPGNEVGIVDLAPPVPDGEEKVYGDEDARPLTLTGLNAANVLLSRMHVDEADPFGFGEPQKHRPVLDLDFPAQLIPSSTPGHFHLLLDKPMAWVTYRYLLIALRDAGLLERGYADAALARGYTAVRLPWIKKESSQ